VASNDTVDLDRVKFPHGSLHWNTLPQLLFNHDAEQVAGHIDSLHWGSKGLQISATVQHEQARRCNAWSVAAVVEEFEIVNGNSPSFYACVTKARVPEISLVESPVNTHALVTNRVPYKTPACVEFFNLTIARVGILQKMFTILAQQMNRPEPSPPPESQNGFGEFGAPAFLRKGEQP
jgi:hypothetical protein